MVPGDSVAGWDFFGIGLEFFGTRTYGTFFWKRGGSFAANAVSTPEPAFPHSPTCCSTSLAHFQQPTNNAHTFFKYHPLFLVTIDASYWSWS